MGIFGIKIGLSDELGKTNGFKNVITKKMGLQLPVGFCLATIHWFSKDNEGKRIRKPLVYVKASVELDEI